MSDILVVYDDTPNTGNEIKNIVGDRSFGNIIFQKKPLREHMTDAIADCTCVKEVLVLDDLETPSAFLEKLTGFAYETPVLHVYSDSVVAGREDFGVLLQKVRFVKDNLTVAAAAGRLTALVFRDIQEYTRFLQQSAAARNTKQLPEFMQFEALKSDALASVSDPDVFLRYITKGFDTRFFNLLAGDEYVVTKTSTNKEKIKSEYTYYHLLPDAMKMWFVMPFDYREDDKSASYSMERFHITDLAIKWVNHSISLGEFEKILTMAFTFIKGRGKKAVSAEQYAREQQSLYIEKLDKRIAQIKQSGIYPAISDYILRGTPYGSIDDIVAEYKALFELIRKKNRFEHASVIGHGDLCFSNMLYHGETSTLKFIDVKGALKEEDLWTDPYYDLAKLSHSICGLYDFFNSNLYEVRLDADLNFYLEIDFDNGEYVEVFKRFLAENGYDYAAVRLFEASLFLSMIPLHVDHPKKVFGFLLNAIKILKGVRQCLKK